MAIISRIERIPWDFVFHIVRNTFELLYFCAGIVFAIVAIRGLEQIKITKQIALTSARREAYKLASEQCDMFASRLVPALEELSRKLKEANNELNGQPLRFSVRDGEILDHSFTEQYVLKNNVPGIVTVLNLFEAFAIPFASKLADDEIGYRETASAFCRNLKPLVVVIWFMRQHKLASYKSAIEVYERWDNRLTLADLQLQKETIEKGMASVKVQRASAIGTEAE